MAGSNGTRMAGEELSKREQRERGRERIGNDPERLAERLSGIDREAYDFEGYSDKDINMAMQGGTFDDNDYARLTGTSVDDGGGDDGGGDDSGGGGGDDGGGVDTTPTPTPSPEEGSDQRITPIVGIGSGRQTQNINQDNDINTNINGSGNTVNNDQDNSIGQYGGGGSWKNAWMKDYFS